MYLKDLIERQLHCSVLIGARVSITALKKLGDNIPDASIITTAFRYCITLLSHLEYHKLNEEREAMGVFTTMLQEVPLHVF